MDRIKIDIERRTSDIDPMIYGNFVEHLGRCVYGGIYDEDSPRSDDEGIRLDVLEATQRLAPTQVRYPGGNFVSGYHWLDGVGPKDARPRRMELAWHVEESNRFGTNEFIQWARRVPTAPVLCVNLGTGTVEEARDWVEYCNGTGNTHFANLRREHGFEEPHNVRIWDLGNEIDGDWQIGHRSADEYARAALECAKLMKWTDKSIRLVACGDSFAREDWNRTVIRTLDGWADYLAFHMYIGRHQRDVQAYLIESWRDIECRIARVEAQVAAEGLRQPPGLAFDEWGIGLPKGASYTLADGLVTALYLNAFLRHARTIRIANYAQLVNVIPTMTTSADDLLLQTTFLPIELYRRHTGSVALDVWCDAEELRTDGAAAPALDAAATCDPDTGRVSVHIVNLDGARARPVRIECCTGTFGGTADLHSMRHPDVEASNSFDAKRCVTVEMERIPANGACIEFELPPFSLVVARAAVR